MNRKEHLQWCKKRALAFLPDNKGQAMISMLSDLRKHKDLETHIGFELGMVLVLSGKAYTVEAVRNFIESCN